MVQGDIKQYNFFIDPKTLQATIIDFGCVSALPRSFVSFTLHRTTNKFVTGIANALGSELSDNSPALEVATGIYCMLSGRRFGK